MKAKSNDEIKAPKSERIWATHYNSHGNPTFVITSKELRDFYYIYEIGNSGVLKKLGKSRSPAELEVKFMKGGEGH